MRAFVQEEQALPNADQANGTSKLFLPTSFKLIPDLLFYSWVRHQRLDYTIRHIVVGTEVS